MLLARRDLRKILNQYLMKLVIWQMVMKDRQRHLMLFFSQSLVLLISLGVPSHWVTGLQEQWFSICGHQNCKGPAVSAEHSQVHETWWDSSQSSEGGCYSRTSLDHLPKVLGVEGGLYWLEIGQCYSHPQKERGKAQEIRDILFYPKFL